ncbi:MAG: PTS glucose transporter subunit IIA [Erysipelotrichaceae bacterium]|nr:PTS glucose transporter subunit IIA [Erysipelotrichaceae bacterium]
MGLFDSLFGKKEPKTYQDSDIVAVVSGPVVRNADIPDPVFAQEMLGKTFAVKPAGDKAVAPANGTLEVMFPTGHAFAVRMADGTGLLVHVGIDTVNLKGKGFKVMASQGDAVKAGQTIVKIDPELIRELGYNPITMLIISENPSEKEFTFTDEDYVYAGNIVCR